MSKIGTKKAGITLVGLVITIIVLLILAGITINLTIGEDGIIKRTQQAGKNYIDAAENEKVQLGQFTNEMDNIIGDSTNSGREPYNSDFRKNVVEAIKNAGVATTENDTDETIVTNIGKILKEATKDATATADNISEGKTAWVNGELITGNGSDNKAYIENSCSIYYLGTGTSFNIASLMPDIDYTELTEANFIAAGLGLNSFRSNDGVFNVFYGNGYTISKNYNPETSVLTISNTSCSNWGVGNQIATATFSTTVAVYVVLGNIQSL